MAMLTPRQKAAVVLSSLSPEAASGLLEEFTPDEVQALTLELWQLPPFDHEVRERVLEEFLAGPSPRSFLESVPPAELAALLLREQSHVIARFLTRLPADYAAAVLSELPRLLRTSVIQEAVWLVSGEGPRRAPGGPGAP